MIRVLLVDDELRVRRGLRMQLEIEPDITIVGEADDGAAVPELAAALQPDVILMDLRMPGVDGISATRRLCAMERPPAVVVISMHDDAQNRASAAAAGAVRFVGKHEGGQRVVAAIREAAGAV